MAKRLAVQEQAGVVVVGRGGFPRRRRPIDKHLIVVNQTVTTAQTATVLHTTTFPATVVGIRWVFSAANILSTASPLLHWAIIILRDGLTASTLATGDGSDLYTPESDVLTFGVTFISDRDSTVGPGIVPFEGATKTMRKLQAGDQLQVITLASDANSVAFDGVVQFFLKT